jgi:hypothetical protein
MFKLKIKTLFLIALMLVSFGFLNPKPALAVLPVADTQTTIMTGLTKIWDALKEAYKKSGSIIFQQTLSNALNKIAIDTATWMASGNTGQTPLVNLKEFGTYLLDITDEAAGEFIERSVKAWSQAYTDIYNADLAGCYSLQKDCSFECINNKVEPLLADAIYEEYDICVNKKIEQFEKNKSAKEIEAEGSQRFEEIEFSCLQKVLKENSSLFYPEEESCFNTCTIEFTECFQKSGKSLAPGQAIMRQVNICQPSSPMGFQVKMQISLGLVDHVRPRAPNCTASDMLRSWYEAGKRIDFTNFDDRQWSQNLTRIFHPTNNELGMATIMSSDMFDVMDKKLDIAKINIAGDGRWLNKKKPDGSIETTAERTKRQQELTEGLLHENIGKMTGEAFIDAGNIFLNTLALQAYQRAMQNLPRLLSGGQDKAGGDVAGGSNNLTDPNADVSRVDVQYGEGASLQERIAEIISPQYQSLDDYNVLSQFVVCPDSNNPGPTDCVIDEGFMQAIMGRQTIIEAINDGNLKAAWSFASDKRDTSAYQLRSLMILRHNRILPVTWEIAAKKIEEEGKQATLMDLVSCFDKDDQYNTFSQTFQTNDVAWCRNLIDPNWVLKAPLSFCRKQGVGNHILSKTVVPGQPAIGSNPATPSSLEIERDNNYCADYQSCIKEGADGTCLFYGYCNEEKRIWTFGQNSCQPVYNTCQSFTSPNNSRVNYLTNTLDFSCNQEDIGCAAYLLRGEFISPRISWDEDFVYYFNNDLKNCSNSSEGCSELIRVKPGAGANLNKLSDLSVYEDGTDLLSTSTDYWQIDASGANTTKEAQIVEFNDEKVINFRAAQAGATSSIGLLSNFTKPITPGPSPVIEGYSYTLSADVYLRNNETMARLILVDWDHTDSIKEDGNNVVDTWQTISVTYHVDEENIETTNDIEFRVQGVALADDAEVDLYIKNIKLEIGSWNSGASMYGAYKSYQKLIPPYLANACYVDAFSGTKDYRLKDDAPEICNNFTRQCNKEEVACELFTNKADNFSVAAKVSTTDYCWSDCDGYDMYIAQASTFHNASSENIIPRNSITCQANEVGCTEFTNLETIARGGEEKEYFSQLRRCIKPSNNCNDFYTWQGSDESGYQLRTMRLEENASGTPELIDPSDTSCSEEIYFKPPSDPEYNPDCRQVYNKNGDIEYVSLFNTIICSANCQEYRMTDKNVNYNIDASADCDLDSNHWDEDISTCYECKDGGVWNDTQEACIYKGLPSESISCSANANGCREYNGKLGSNVRLISAFDFKNGLAGWTTGPCTGIADVPTLSQTSTSNNGNSLKYDTSSTMTCDEASNNLSAWLPIKRALAMQEGNGIKLPLGYNLRQDKAYSLRFLAKAESSDVMATFSIENSTSTKTLFNPEEIEIINDGQWRIYDLYLPALNYQVNEETALVIRADNSFFIDSLILNEVSDKYYLIKNSSFIPDICYYDVLDVYRGADYNLGCSAWTGRQNTNHYLRRFSAMCNESSVGCELMIKTHNYSQWGSLDYLDIEVPADEFIYAIYNPNYSCSASNKGCSRMVQLNGQGINRSLTEVYKNNNPDNYEDSICSEEAVGCQQFNSGAGVYYFKDPGFNTCVYRHSNDPENLEGKNWYKSEVKRCDISGDGEINGPERFGRVCLSDNDCTEEISCIADKNDYPCSVSYLKTIGLGDRIPTPDVDVGLCENDSVGCTEYIDPYSQHVSNLIFNPEYLNNREGWDDDDKQAINILPNTLYQFSSDFSGPSASFDFSVDVLADDNTFITEDDDLAINSNEQVFIFNSRRNTSALIDNSGSDSYITLKPIILDYQLRQNLDTSSCNGIVNVDNGCVLFNQRSVSGADYNAFSFNPFATEVNKSAQACQAGDLNCLANTLIKVQPDRTCARWLDCLTYVDDPETGERICYDLGECTSLDEYGRCSNFVSYVDASNSPLLSNVSTPNPNASGYSSIDRYYIGEMEEVGINTEVHFDFEDNNIALHCINESGLPCNFDNNIISDSIIDGPARAEVEYPAQGKKYLKVPANSIMYPHSQSISYKFEIGRTYYLHYLLNTSKSGVDAKVEIYSQDDPDYNVSLSASANSGWERIIHRFSVSSTTDYQIRFTSDENEDSFYYVDDIHIEPVLQVGPDQYVAKDCRLFPETSSFACRSAFDNVVKNGLEGYCLERDPNNKNTCLMWYPVDQISSSKLYGGTNFGYQGKAPLYYCSEVNADFKLLEKRKAIKIGQHKKTSPATIDRCYIDGSCGGEGGGWNYVSIRESKSGSDIENIYCVPRLDRADVRIGIPTLLPDSHGICNNLSQTQIGVMSIGTSTVFINDYGIEAGFYDVWGEADGFHSVGGGTQHNDTMNCRQCSDINELTAHDSPIAIYDLIEGPKTESNLKFLHERDVNKVYNLSCNSFVELVDSYGMNKAWAKRVSSASDNPYNTPDFMLNEVLDSDFSIASSSVLLEACIFEDSIIDDCYAHQSYNLESYDGCETSAGEYCHEVESGADTYCEFNENLCDKDNETDCEDIDSCQWQDSLLIEYETSFNRYGRNREDVPFGAAVLPDNFSFYSSPLIPLRNQYSKNSNSDILAGRPYGCDGDSCDKIGQCSLDPNVFCIYDDYIGTNINKTRRAIYINDNSCANGNYGVCTPLWWGNFDKLKVEQTNQFFQYPLQSLFLRSFQGLKYNPETRLYESAHRIRFQNRVNDTLRDLTLEDAMLPCSNPTRDSEDWCAIYPEVSNLKLSDLAGTDIATSSPNISAPGIYKLSFNTKVDSEQQPLNRIEIDWGDNNFQIINNQDHRPFDNRPHQVYHYYSPGEYEINVKIIDNWGFWGNN